MSLQAERTIRAGLDRLRTSAALALAAVLFLLGPPTTLYPVDESLFPPPIQYLLERPAETVDLIVQNPDVLVTLLVTGALLLAILLVVGVLTLWLVLVAIRTFAADERQRVRREHLTDGVVPGLLNYVAGTVVAAVAVSVGLALFVAPGVYLAVSLAFWPVAVAVEEENVVDGFRRSWELADGNRWEILATGFGTLVVAALIAGVGSLVGGSLLAAASGALAWIFVLAVLVEGYRDLAGVGTVDVAERTGPAGESGSSAGERSTVVDQGSEDPGADDDAGSDDDQGSDESEATTDDDAGSTTDGDSTVDDGDDRQ